MRAPTATGQLSPVCMMSRTNFSIRAEPAAGMEDPEIDAR